MARMNGRHERITKGAPNRDGHAKAVRNDDYATAGLTAVSPISQLPRMGPCRPSVPSAASAQGTQTKSVTAKKKQRCWSSDLLGSSSVRASLSGDLSANSDSSGDTSISQLHGFIRLLSFQAQTSMYRRRLLL